MAARRGVSSAGLPTENASPFRGATAGGEASIETT
ncbi:MAG: hypothetical protein QOD41_106, partial [Cryptosporangiaceae bacterium]|nr:hypothetical protein [Cryptosporangiaceae bacterium]